LKEHFFQECFFRKEKAPRYCATLRLLYGSLNLTGTQAMRADIDSFGLAVHHCLNSSHIGLPGSVGFSIGMTDLQSEGYTLTANFTLCHRTHLPQRASFQNLLRLYHRLINKSSLFLIFFKFISAFHYFSTKDLYFHGKCGKLYPIHLQQLGQRLYYG
jgi:hypothetical protein